MSLHHFLISKSCVIAILFCSLSAADAQVAEPITEYLESFDQAWEIIKKNHWDKEMEGLDWDAVREELRPRVETAETASEAQGVIQELIERVGKSHYAYIPEQVFHELEGEKDRRGPGRVGLSVRVINGSALVTAVEKNGSAESAGVGPGWEILEIKGNPIDSVIEKISQNYADSTQKQIQLVQALEGRLSGQVGEDIPIVFRNEKNEPKGVSLSCMKPRGKKVRFGNLPSFYFWFESKELNAETGYVAFNCFFDPPILMKSFEEAVKSFQGKKGMIIDLRGNPGGIGGLAMGIAGWLVKEEGKKLGTMIQREVRLKFVIFPRLEVYEGAVAILVDGTTGSTGEIFAGGMKDIGRARIFGTRTAGAALPSVFTKLPNGDGLQYAIANYISENGETLEGRGVLPDEEVFMNREELLQGRDPVLESAVRWIEKQ